MQGHVNKNRGGLCLYVCVCNTYIHIHTHSASCSPASLRGGTCHLWSICTIPHFLGSCHYTHTRTQTEDWSASAQSPRGREKQWAAGVSLRLLQLTNGSVGGQHGLGSGQQAAPLEVGADSRGDGGLICCRPRERAALKGGRWKKTSSRRRELAGARLREGGPVFSL